MCPWGCNGRRVALGQLHVHTARRQDFHQQTHSSMGKQARKGFQSGRCLQVHARTLQNTNCILGLFFSCTVTDIKTHKRLNNYECFFMFSSSYISFLMHCHKYQSTRLIFFPLGQGKTMCKFFGIYAFYKVTNRQRADRQVIWQENGETAQLSLEFCQGLTKIERKWENINWGPTRAVAFNCGLMMMMMMMMAICKVQQCLHA